MILEINEKCPKLGKDCFIAATAVLSGDVEVGESTNIWFNTVMRGDVNKIVIGHNSNIQDGCTVHSSVAHPTIIGNHTVLGHNAVVHACNVGNNVLIGIGATVLDGAIIGDNVIIGANTLIPPGKVIESNSVVMGNPYKIVRKFTDKDHEMIKGILLRYVEWSKVYKHNVKEVGK